MKRNSTMIRLLLAIIVALSITMGLNAQTTVNVVLTNFQFSPNEVTIDVGDEVRWINEVGTHNVNGMMSIYPANPESFGNSIGSGWVYSYTFNTPGVYNYHCDPHQLLGMTGKVTVLSTTGIEDLADGDDSPVKAVYPNPASEFVVIELSDDVNLADDVVKVRVFSAVGKEVLLLYEINDKEIEINILGYSPGVYFYQLVLNSNAVETGKLVIR